MPSSRFFSIFGAVFILNTVQRYRNYSIPPNFLRKNFNIWAIIL
nr:MAG TPA: hypothetical protein [Caudoviricetes sp.]